MATADELTAAIGAIERDGSIVNIGQVSPQVARGLDRFVKAGKLVKYRGFWSTRSPRFGFGPLKTIWATPEFAALVEAA